MEFTKSKKQELEKAIVDVCIGALENQRMSDEQMGEVSSFVLSQIDLIKTQDEILVFLENLSERWGIFKNLLDIEKGEGEVAKEKNAISSVEKYIKQGKIEEALKVAKKATIGKDKII